MGRELCGKDVADRERPAETPSIQSFDKGYSRSFGSAALAVDGVGATYVMYMNRFRTRLPVFLLSQA